MIRRIFYTICK